MTSSLQVNSTPHLAPRVNSELHRQEDQLIAQLTSRVRRIFADAESAGVSAEAFADVEKIADAMAAAIPLAHPFDAIVGPFYDTAGLTKWWGVSRQSISKKVSARSLIACQLDDGQWVYPTWQFTKAATVHPNLIRIWRTLREAADPWTCALWLQTPHPDFSNFTACHWISEGNDLAIVQDAATADAFRWSA